PGYNFDDEPHPDRHFNEPYMLAMANAGKGFDGSGTNGSQFFITVSPTQYLHGKHTVFGEVADEESRKVVDKIAAVATDHNDKPHKDVVIESISFE
ncbi:MAG: peptidylprolyl isomerase, partial [Rhodoluna sp.]